MSWLVLLVLASAPAQAQDEDRAKELFREGADLYDNGRYEGAINAWAQAYDLSQKPLLLFNLANAYERTAQFEKALDALTRYQPDAKPDETETIEARIASLQSRAEAEKKERELEEAEKRAREAELEAQRQAAELARQQAEAARNQKGTPAPILPIVTTGAGVGLLGVGVVSGLGAASARRTLKDPAVCGDTGVCTSAADDAVSKQRSNALVADVTLFTGLAATGLGTFLFVKHVQNNKKEPTTAFWAAPGADGATLGVSGAF